MYFSEPMTTWIIIGFFVGLTAVDLVRSLPEPWLCDYGKALEFENSNNKRWQLWSLYCSLLCGIGMAAAIAGLPLPENRTGMLFVLVLAGFLSLFALLLLMISDLIFGIIPDQLVMVMMIAGLIYQGCNLPTLEGILGGALGGIVGALAVFLIGVGGGGLTKKEVMGFGDVKLMAATGCFCGIREIATVLCLTFLLTGTLGLLMLLSGKTSRNATMPLAPFVFVAVIVAQLFPDFLL